jgi:hypothetical protein
VTAVLLSPPPFLFLFLSQSPPFLFRVVAASGEEAPVAGVLPVTMKYPSTAAPFHLSLLPFHCSQRRCREETGAPLAHFSHPTEARLASRGGVGWRCEGFRSIVNLKISYATNKKAKI